MCFVYSTGSTAKKTALAGNRTRASRVAGENSTTEPPVLVLLSVASLPILTKDVSKPSTTTNFHFSGACHRFLHSFVALSFKR